MSNLTEEERREVREAIQRYIRRQLNEKGAAVVKQLASFALAAHEQEPVYLVPIEDEPGRSRRLWLEVPATNWLAKAFYAHPAPSIPTVSFYRDGIVAAADWVDAQREAYDSEHGRHDPDTSTFEFGNEAQLEYSSALAEIAEGIRALHSNASSGPSIPAAVPEVCNFNFDDFMYGVRRNPPFRGETLADNLKDDAVELIEDAFRAAMLQSEPVKALVTIYEYYPDNGWSECNSKEHYDELTTLGHRTRIVYAAPKGV